MAVLNYGYGGKETKTYPTGLNRAIDNYQSRLQQSKPQTVSHQRYGGPKKPNISIPEPKEFPTGDKSSVIRQASHLPSFKNVGDGVFRDELGRYFRIVDGSYTRNGRTINGKVREYIDNPLSGGPKKPTTSIPAPDMGGSGSWNPANGGGSSGGGQSFPDFSEWLKQNPVNVGGGSGGSFNGGGGGSSSGGSGSGGQASNGPVLPDEIDIDKYKVDAVTIEDLAKKYGFDYSMDYAKRVAEAEAQAKRDEIAAQRERVESEKNQAQTDMQHDFFQQFLNQQQALVNDGLNAGLAEDRNIRLEMSRQNALGDLFAESALANRELDRQGARISQEEIMRADTLYNERLQQAFENAMQLTGQERQNQMAILDRLMEQRNQQVQEAWREYEFNNMSASEKARFQQDAEQFGMEMAWKRYQFEKGLEFEAGYNSFNGGTGNAPRSSGLGSLSQKYESSGNPAAIGYDSTGGYSYGTYQIATNTGTMRSFQNFVKQYPKFSQLASLSPGSSRFNSVWKTLAKQYPEEFNAIQHNFIKASHYDPARRKIEDSLGINLSRYPKAVHDVLWSTAVQHGSSGARNVWKNAGIRPGMSPQEVITRVYRERMASGGRKYFGSSTSRVRQAVVNRFKRELQDALAML